MADSRNAVTYTLTARDPFHAGWVAGLLGLPCDPPATYVAMQKETYHAGYDTALDTYYVPRIAEAMQAMHRLQQVVTEVQR